MLGRGREHGVFDEVVAQQLERVVVNGLLIAAFELRRAAALDVFDDRAWNSGLTSDGFVDGSLDLRVPKAGGDEDRELTDSRR